MKLNSSFGVSIGPLALLEGEFEGRGLIQDPACYGLRAKRACLVRMQDHEFCETVQTFHQIE
jgi:hypothetical protein